ncbi:unnamed protein product [Brassica oleracea var. botrytis]
MSLHFFLFFLLNMLHRSSELFLICPFLCFVSLLISYSFSLFFSVLCLSCWLRLELTPPLLQMGYLNKNDRVAVGEELSYMEKSLS